MTRNPQETHSKVLRSCSPTLGQVDWFRWKTPQSQSHPVPPNLNTPLSQSHPIPHNMETLLSQSHPVPPNMEDPCPCPTCTSTCPNLSHFSVPPVLSQLPFLRFFLVSHCQSTSWKTLVGTRLLIRRTNLQRSYRWFRGFIIAHVWHDSQMGWVSLAIFPPLLSLKICPFSDRFLIRKICYSINHS